MSEESELDALLEEFSGQSLQQCFRNQRRLKAELAAANERLARLEKALAGEATEEMLEAGYEGSGKRVGTHLCNRVFKAMRDAALKENP